MTNEKTYEVSLHSVVDEKGALIEGHTGAPVIGDSVTAKEAAYEGFARTTTGKGKHVNFPAPVAGKHTPHYLTHATLSENGKIVKVITLKPPILTQDGIAPVIWEPDLLA